MQRMSFIPALFAACCCGVERSPGQLAIKGLSIGSAVVSCSMLSEAPGPVGFKKSETAGRLRPRPATPGPPNSLFAGCWRTEPGTHHLRNFASPARYGNGHPSCIFHGLSWAIDFFLFSFRNGPLVKARRYSSNLHRHPLRRLRRLLSPERKLDESRPCEYPRQQDGVADNSVGVSHPGISHTLAAAFVQ